MPVRSSSKSRPLTGYRGRLWVFFSARVETAVDLRLMLAWKVVLLLGVLAVPIQLGAQRPLNRLPRREPWPESSAQMTTAHPQFGDPKRRWASADRLASSWNHLLEEMRSSRDLFSKDEETSINLLLRQLQDGLVALGVV